MKQVFILVILSLAIPAFAVPCKVERTDGVHVFGLCLKKKDSKVVFYSCADFVCETNSEQTRVLPKDVSPCEKSDKDILEMASTGLDKCEGSK